MTSRAAQYARRLAEAVREQLRDATSSGRRWRRPAAQCPDWCAEARCTARERQPRGEHRSNPQTWHTPYGFLLVTLVQTVAGRLSIELRVDARLADRDDTARAQAQHLAVGIDLTVRAVLADTARSLAVAQLPARTPDALDRWLATITREAGAERRALPPAG